MPIPAKDDKVVIPDLPEHWDLGGEIHPIQVPRNLTLFIHQLLCFMGLGYANLQTVWEKSHTSAWRTTRKDMMGRLQHVNLMNGLLLATVSAFCTTAPPADSRILPYNKTVPYCLVVSMAFILVGIVVCAAGVFIIHKIDPAWFREVAMGSKRRIWVTTIILSFPSLVAILSMAFFAAGRYPVLDVLDSGNKSKLNANPRCFRTGVIVASASSEIPFIKFVLGLFALPPLLSLVAIAWFVCFRPGVLVRLSKHLAC